MALDTAYWTWLNHAFLWGSIAIYFGLSFILYEGECPLHCFLICYLKVSISYYSIVRLLVNGLWKPSKRPNVCNQDKLLLTDVFVVGVSLDWSPSSSIFLHWILPVLDVTSLNFSLVLLSPLQDGLVHVPRSRHSLHADTALLVLHTIGAFLSTFPKLEWLSAMNWRVLEYASEILHH